MCPTMATEPDDLPPEVAELIIDRLRLSRLRLTSLSERLEAKVEQLKADRDKLKAEIAAKRAQIIEANKKP